MSTVCHSEGEPSHLLARAFAEGFGPRAEQRRSPPPTPRASRCFSVWGCNRGGFVRELNAQGRSATSLYFFIETPVLFPECSSASTLDPRLDWYDVMSEWFELHYKDDFLE